MASPKRIRNLDAVTADGAYHLALDTGSGYLKRATLSASVQAVNAAMGLYDVTMSASATAATNAAAVQAKIDAAYAAGGGIVRLPAGTFSCAGIVLKSGVTLEGAGHGSNYTETSRLGTVLNVSGAVYGVTLGGQQYDTYMTVRNLSIAGTSSGKGGIRIGHHQTDATHTVTNCLIENVRIYGFTSASVSHDVSTGDPAATGAAGIYLARGVTCTLRNVYVVGCYYGLLENSTHYGTTFVFDQCSFRECTLDGAHLRDFVSFTFRNCVFESNYRYGLAVIPQAGNASPAHLSIRDCYTENNCRSSGDYEVYLDCANAYMTMLRVNGLNMNPAADTGYDPAHPEIPYAPPQAKYGLYLRNVRHGLITLATAGRWIPPVITSTGTEGILYIGPHPDTTTGVTAANTIAAGDGVQLLMRDDNLVVGGGLLSVESLPFRIKTASSAGEEDFMQVLRNTSQNAFRLITDAAGDAYLSLHKAGGTAQTYLMSGDTDETIVSNMLRVAKLGTAYSAGAPSTEVTNKILVYDSSGNALGYIGVHALPA